MPPTTSPVNTFDDTPTFSLRRMRKGVARKLLLAGAVLMCVALSATWSTQLSSGGVTTSTYLGGGATQRITYSGGEAGGGSAFGKGVVRYPLLLLLAALGLSRE